MAGSNLAITDPLDLEDPYTCGAGFHGFISGGSAPVELTYILAGDSTVTMTPFSTGIGAYHSPDGFIDYDTFVDGSYSVSIHATDAAGGNLALNDAFVADITDDCGAAVVPTATPTPRPAGVIVTSPSSAPAVEVAEFTIAPSQLAGLSSNAAAFIVPDIQPQETTATGGGTGGGDATDGAATGGTTDGGTTGGTDTGDDANAGESPGLAQTGSETQLLATLSVLLLALGGFLMIAARREVQARQ